jgi:hypothetical protein
VPRRTRKQLVGKQEDIDRDDREAALRELAWELHLAWFIGEKKSPPTILNLTIRVNASLKAKHCP